jgi:hypothetical protein
MVIQGYGGAHIAIKSMGKKRYLGVIYKEFIYQKD